MTHRVSNTRKFYLYSLANVNIVNDERLLLELTEVDSNIIGATGSTTAKKKGILPRIGEALVMPNCKFNIISWGYVESVSSIRYLQGDNVIASMNNGDEIYFWRDHKIGAYYCLLPETITSNMYVYQAHSAGDSARAGRARELMRRLGYPSDASLIDLLNNGGIVECNVTAEDVRIAKRLLGPDSAVIKGKFNPRKSIYMHDSTPC
jgi:hypothetical protein